MEGRGRAHFGPQAEDAIRSVQSAFLEMFERAGLGGSRAADVARTLNLDKTLAWKLMRCADDQDPRSAFKHLPGPGGVEIAIRAAGKHGVAEETLETVRRATEELRVFVRRHAGDRRTFEAMLAGTQPDPETEAEERKAYYQAGSAIWGVRAQAQILTLALKPSDTIEGRVDVVQVSGFVGLERLRPDLPWVLRRLRVHEDDGSLAQSFKREPLDPSGAPHGADSKQPLALMPRFCTEPLPEIQQHVGASGWLYDELAPGSVGKRGAVTVISGERYHGALPLARSSENTEGRYVLTVRTPVEVVQFDLLLHPDLAHFRWPTVRVVGNLEEQLSARDRSGRELFPVRPADSVSPGVSRGPGVGAFYRDLMSDAFERAGWGDLAGYRAFRAEVEYPPAPCEVVMTSELSESH